MHKNTEHLCPLLHLCIFSITSITNIPLPPPLFLCLSLLFIPHLPIYLCLSLFLKISSPHRGAGRSFSLNELERRQHTHSRKTTSLYFSIWGHKLVHTNVQQSFRNHTHTQAFLKSKTQTLIYPVLPSQTGRHTQSNRPKGRMGIFVYTLQLESGTILPSQYVCAPVHLSSRFAVFPVCLSSHLPHPSLAFCHFSSSFSFNWTFCTSQINGHLSLSQEPWSWLTIRGNRPSSPSCSLALSFFVRLAKQSHLCH